MNNLKSAYSRDRRRAGAVGLSGSSAAAAKLGTLVTRTDFCTCYSQSRLAFTSSTLSMGRRFACCFSWVRWLEVWSPQAITDERPHQPDQVHMLQGTRVVGSLGKWQL